MKFSTYILLGSLAVLASGAMAGAQDVQIQIQPKLIQIQPKVAADQPLLPAGVLEKLKLTPEQTAQLPKLEAEYKEKAKAAKDKYDADAKTLRDREQFKEAQDKMKADINKAREVALGKLEPKLSDEQKATLKQVQAEQPKVQPNPGGIIVRPPVGAIGGINPVLPPATQKRLQLTEEQLKQIADIQKEIEAKVMKVLTDEQKKTLEQMKKGPVIRPLPLQQLPRIQIQPAVPQVLPANPKKD